MSQLQGISSESLFENLKNAGWLSVKDASKLYPISINTFYKHKLNGLPVRHLGRKLIVKKSDLEEWLERWAALKFKLNVEV